MLKIDLTNRKSARVFSASGFLIGAMISLAVIGQMISCNGMAINPSGYFSLHVTGFMVYFFDLLPFMLAFAAYRMFLFFYTCNQQLSSVISDEKSKNETISDFLEKLSGGDFSTQYNIAAEDDHLGQSIVNLRGFLIQNREAEEQRRKEDNQRNWVTEGLAKFGEILRQNNSNIEELSSTIIVNLVKYMGANQGGFFMLRTDENEKKYFELTGCYAWERKKFCDKRIEWAEGLIGACALEKDIIYMTDVPDKYITITSGLGDANPRCIIIVPLIINEEVQGIIEMASFKVIEPFEMDFIRKLAESIASTLYSVKSNLQTRKLLEQSQHQAEELAQQEEELRQNLEELRVTQEQIAVQSRELEVFTDAVNHSMLRAEFDTEGKLSYANDKFVEKMGYAMKAEVMNKHVSVFINTKDQESFFAIWEKLIENGSQFEGELKFQTKQGKDIWTMMTIVPVKNDYASVDKIIILGNDITNQKELNLDYEAQIEALNRSSLKAQFLSDGMMVDCNDIMREIMNIESEEVVKKSIFEMISKDAVDSFREIWNDVMQGNPYKGQLKQITYKKEERWFQCTLTSVLNMYGEIVKIIYIANDITEQKMMEFDTQKQADLLRQQEEQLKQSQLDLSKKLDEARREMTEQFKEIEKIKVRNERTLEGAHDAIFTIDKTGRIEFFNKAAELLWGLSKEDVVGKNINMLFSENAKKEDEFIAALVNGAEKQIGLRKEVKIKKKTGEESPVLILLSEARINDEHTFTGFIQNIEVELF